MRWSWWVLVIVMCISIFGASAKNDLPLARHLWTGMVLCIILGHIFAMKRQLDRIEKALPVKEENETAKAR